MRWWRCALAALSLAAALSAVGGGPTQEDWHTRSWQRWQRGLLAVMGLKRRPSPSSHRQRIVPDAMRNLYRRIAAGTPFLPDHQLGANTVRSFAHKESTIDRRFKGHHKFRLSFNVSLPEDEWLRVAELVLSRDAIRDGASMEKHGVAAYDIVRPGKRGGDARPPVLRLLDEKRVRPERGGEVRLDITAAAERWLWHPSENHGVLVVVTAPGPHGPHGPHVRLRRSAADSPASWRARQPVLLAYTDDGRERAARLAHASRGGAGLRRSARAAANHGGHRRPHRRKDGHDMCQRRPLYVDFHDVGWSDWIVAPPGYDAYYCHGDCSFPLAQHLNSSNHAVVQTIINSINAQAVPKACCVPTDLTGISMLYLDEEDKVVLKNYQDMSVINCGCR